MRDDGVNCWLDPVYRGPGKPMGCKPDQEKKGNCVIPSVNQVTIRVLLNVKERVPKEVLIQVLHAYNPLKIILMWHGTIGDIVIISMIIRAI